MTTLWQTVLGSQARSSICRRIGKDYEKWLKKTSDEKNEEAWRIRAEMIERRTGEKRLRGDHKYLDYLHSAQALCFLRHNEAKTKREKESEESKYLIVARVRRARGDCCERKNDRSRKIGLERSKNKRRGAKKREESYAFVHVIPLVRREWTDEDYLVCNDDDCTEPEGHTSSVNYVNHVHGFYEEELSESKTVGYGLSVSALESNVESVALSRPSECTNFIQKLPHDGARCRGRNDVVLKTSVDKDSKNRRWESDGSKSEEEWKDDETLYACLRDDLWSIDARKDRNESLRFFGLVGKEKDDGDAKEEERTFAWLSNEPINRLKSYDELMEKSSLERSISSALTHTIDAQVYAEYMITQENK